MYPYRNDTEDFQNITDESRNCHHDDHDNDESNFNYSSPMMQSCPMMTQPASMACPMMDQFSFNCPMMNMYQFESPGRDIEENDYDDDSDDEDMYRHRRHRRRRCRRCRPYYCPMMPWCR